MRFRELLPKILKLRNIYFSVILMPFPNDSGMAIGAAVAEMVHGEKKKRLRWDIYQPPTSSRPDVSGWRSKKCDEAGLARILRDTGESVVVLNGRADAGPACPGEPKHPRCRYKLEDKRFPE